MGDSAAVVSCLRGRRGADRSLGVRVRHAVADVGSASPVPWKPSYGSSCSRVWQWLSRCGAEERSSLAAYPQMRVSQWNLSTIALNTASLGSVSVCLRAHVQRFPSSGALPHEYGLRSRVNTALYVAVHIRRGKRGGRRICVRPAPLCVNAANRHEFWIAFLSTWLWRWATVIACIVRHPDMRRRFGAPQPWPGHQ